MQCSGIFTDWMRKLSSRQGAKPEKNGLPFGAGCIFGGVAAKSAFAFTFDKSNKTYSASDFACRLVFGWNMIRCGQIFM
ncbi:MAG: hypothetical protein BHV87_08895 [Clostridiales bacterium 36_14]|nr:MAG: hypothetical protein BHV87_08895 [Clostridiales bacterium 36_14]